MNFYYGFIYHFQKCLILLTYFLLNLTLKPKFINVKPLSRMALNYSASDWNRTFAYSKFANQNSKYEAYRIISASNPPGNGEGVFIKNLLSAKIDFIPMAEDPRIIEIRNKIFLQYQIFNPQKGDCEIFLRDLNTNSSYQLVSPFQLTGKNWSFFESLDTFLCVYSFNPLIFLCGEIIENKKIIEFSMIGENEVNQLKWGEVGENLIGSIRGGTPFIKLDERYWLSFTHSTPYGPNREQHSLGCAVIDLQDLKIYHLNLTKQRMKLLVDAYGIQKSTNSVYAYLSLGSGHPGRKNEYFITNYIEFKIQNLLDKCLEQKSIGDLNLKFLKLFNKSQ